MNLIPFQYESVAIRVVEFDGEPWFVGADVARALGYAKPHDAIDRHCKGSVKHGPLQTGGGTQVVKFIGEADVLRLIIGSNLQAAQRFERWVFEDVLPAIRKTGRYAIVEPIVPRTLPEALRLAADLADRNTALVAQVAEQAPKVAALDRIETADGAFCLTAAAKALQLAPHKFTKWLADRGWIYRRGRSWAAYQSHIERGVLVHKLYTAPSHTSSEPPTTYEQVMVTAKGMAALAKMLESVPQRSVGSVAERSIAILTERLR
jgi:prophage antirepressor-like protein